MSLPVNWIYVNPFLQDTVSELTDHFQFFFQEPWITLPNFGGLMKSLLKSKLFPAIPVMVKIDKLVYHLASCECTWRASNEPAGGGAAERQPSHEVRIPEEDTEVDGKCNDLLLVFSDALDVLSLIVAFAPY